MKKISGVVIKKNSWNLWVIKNDTLHIVHEDDFDSNVWKKIKVGDRVEAFEWYSINYKLFNKIIDEMIDNKFQYSGKSNTYLALDIQNGC